MAKDLENWKRSGDFCKELLKRLYNELVQSVADGSVSTTEGLETRWQQFLRAYEKESKGPAKYSEFFKAADVLLEAARKVTQLEVASAEEKCQFFPCFFFIFSKMINFGQILPSDQEVQRGEGEGQEGV